MTGEKKPASAGGIGVGLVKMGAGWRGRRWRRGAETVATRPAFARLAWVQTETLPPEMTQQLKQPYQLVCHQKIVLTRPAHAAGIGLVAAEWSALEVQLIQLFRYALFDFRKATNEAADVAVEAWNAMVSIHTRLEFLEAIASRKLPNELLEEFANTIKPAVRKKSTLRNNVIHGHWHTSPQYPDDLILVADGKETLRYSVRDFDEIADNINATNKLVTDYWHRVQAQIQPRLTGEEFPPPLPLLRPEKSP
jgi:hypothetical protein